MPDRNHVVLFEPSSWSNEKIHSVSIGGTAAYDGEVELPALVAEAVALAKKLHFEYSCFPAQGRLLQVLARGCSGGVIGETGTGCGVGLAWMASAVDPMTKLISVEIDPQRAAAAQTLFSNHPNVLILHTRWNALTEYSPFDLVVLDGGGTGKQAVDDSEPVDPAKLLRRGGTLVIDDFSPSLDWPRRYGPDVDHVRMFWLQHPDLIATEISITNDMCAVIATRR